MKITIGNDLMKKLVEKGCKNSAIIETAANWYNENLNSKYLTDEDIILIKENIEADTSHGKKLLRKIKLLESIRSSSNMPIKSLEGIAEALIKLIKPLPNKRIYKEDENGKLR